MDVLDAYDWAKKEFTNDAVGNLLEDVVTPDSFAFT